MASLLEIPVFSMASWILVPVNQGMDPQPAITGQFTGNINHAIASISWQNGVEVNFKGYELEKSIDGKSFSKIAGIPPKGGHQFYTYQAPQPQPTASCRLCLPSELLYNCFDFHRLR